MCKTLPMACHTMPSQVGHELPPCRSLFTISMQALTGPQWHSTNKQIGKA